MIHRAENGALIHEDGRVLHQPLELWLSRVKNHNFCFSCGKSRDEVVFNDEHVVPQWVLRRFGLHNEEVTLPNLSRIRYDRYKVPCCQSCNDLYGRVVETPMSELVNGGYDRLVAHIGEFGPGLLLAWLSLLVFKLHYRDVTLPINRDLRRDEGMIGDNHDWDTLHLVHSFATMPYTNAKVSSDAIGTMGIVKAVTGPNLPIFDLMDVPHLRSIMIQMDDILILHNVNDAGALQGWLTKNVADYHCALTQVQARELGLRLAFGFASLRNPPLHRVQVSVLDPKVIEIACEHEDVPDFRGFDKQLFGRFLYPQLMDFLPMIRVAGKSEEEVAEMMKRGDFTSLRDADGNFLDQSSTTP